MRLNISVWVGVLIVVAIILGFFIWNKMFSPSGAAHTGEAYQIENIQMPEGLNSEVGGIGFLPDGRLIACFHRGEVMTYDTQTKEWKLFAEGLHDPLGLLVVSNNEILIM